MQKYEFLDFPPELVKSKCTKDYDFYTIGRITDLQSGNFVEATLKVPKGACWVHFKFDYHI